MALNDKQRRFVAEYLIDLNATQAAIRAGYSEKTAYSAGQRMLKNVEIQNAIAEAKTKRSERTEITQDRVLQEMAAIGFSDLRQIFDENGNLRGPDDWPDIVAPAISGIDVTVKNLGEGEVEHIAKIKLWDKGRALENLAKHLGMLGSDVNVDMNGFSVVINTQYDDDEAA